MISMPSPVSTKRRNGVPLSVSRGGFFLLGIAMTEFSSGEFRDYMKKQKPKRRHKYNAKSCRCQLGNIHASRGESACCDMIHNMFPKAEIKSQHRVILYVNGKKVTTHVIDWQIIHEDGHEEVWEFKGMETNVWRLKHKLFEALYPDIPYVIIRKRDLI